MSESYESLRRLFSDAGYGFVEPPIVHDASVFVELAGEDLRRRLFLTSAADGTELALRPDYTIPVCLHHIASGPARRAASYAYLGPVFRQRRDEPGEFLQAGVESLGRSDRIGADADTLKLAFDAAALLGVKKPNTRIGDSALFGAVLDDLDLSAPWQRRLERNFGDAARLDALITKANGAAPSPAPRSRAAVRKQAAAMLAASGLTTIGGRTAEEIAERVVEKSVIAAGIGGRAADVLSRYLAIGGTPARAIPALRALAKKDGVSFGKALDRFEARVAALDGHGIDLDKLTFAANFGRRLDYYTGFVFEIHDAARPKTAQIVGGGRYDRLMALIGGEVVPAVGFAIWLDRIGGKR